MRHLLPFLLCLGTTSACGAPVSEPQQNKTPDVDMTVDLDAGAQDTAAPDLDPPDLPADLPGDTTADLGPQDMSQDVEPDVPADLPVEPARVPAFVAVGQGGRTVLSCDGGRTWRHDRFENEDNGDHEAYSGKGLAYGAGVFVAGFGWGAPGRAWVSRDAVRWEESLTPMENGLGDVVYGDGVFLVSTGRTIRSSPDGRAWTDLGSIPRELGLQHVRGMGYGDGAFFIGGSERLLRSTDQGRTWAAAQTYDPACVAGVGRRGGWAWDGAGTIVVNGNTGIVCWSQDQGDTWTSVDLGASLSGNVVWSGSGFLIGAGSSVWKSLDGKMWSQAALPDRPDVRYVAHGDGVFVGISRDGERFYRSEDGATWEPAAQAPGGTDLVAVRFGFIEPTSECPAR